MSEEPLGQDDDQSRNYDGILGFVRLFTDTLRAQYRAGYRDAMGPDVVGGDYEETIERLQRLDPETFEEVIANLYEKRGYSAKTTNPGADGGIDIIAEKEDVTVAIQAKRYTGTNRVGAKTVRETYGAARRIRAQRPAIATTNDFTSTAIEEADQLGVKLMNVYDIASEISD